MSTKILIVDDNFAVSLALKQALKPVYDVDIAHTGARALEKLESYQYQTVILDLSLPDMNGTEVCNTIRRLGNTVPIIVLSAETAPSRKVELLDSGADDYLTKPFSVDELKARLRLTIRRTRSLQTLGSKLTINGVSLDSVRHTVERDGINIALRPKEFAVLECLMNNAGHVVSRAVLLQYAWEETADVWTNVVDVHIKHLRDRLDAPFATPLIKTVHGLGYKFDASKVANTTKGGDKNESVITNGSH